jgi:transcriptional regulator with XRE-family HTH domain
MSPPTAPPPANSAAVPWRSLRHYRKNVAGISVAELARRANLSKSHIEHLEAGRRNPRKQTVERLAKALGVTADKLRADLADNPAAKQELDDLRQQVAVLSERIEHVAAALPNPRTKTAQEVA